MHYELCFLHMAQSFHYDIQSSCMTFTATVTSYIWDSKKSDLHVETTSFMKDILVAFPFHDSFIILLGFSTIHLGYQITTFAMSDHSYDISLMGSTVQMTYLDKTVHLDLHLPTIQGYMCMSIVSLLPQDGELHIFIKNLGYVLVVLDLSNPEIISICDSMMTSS